MLARTKHRSPSWQQSLLLLVFGSVIGYLSFVHLNLWGGTESRYQNLYIMGFFAAALAFLVGILCFLAITIKSVTAPTGPATIATPSRAYTGAISPAMPRQASVPTTAAATSRLRITLAALVTLACIVVLRQWGQPSLTSSYGRSYWLSAVLTLLLSQLPYALALVRTWKVPDRAGLALAIAAGATQVFVTFFPDLRYTALRLDPWPWLSASLGIAAVVFAALAWRPFFSRKGDVGLLIAIFSGFVVYTALAQIALAVIARMHLL